MGGFLPGAFGAVETVLVPDLAGAGMVKSGEPEVEIVLVKGEVKGEVNRAFKGAIDGLA